MEIQADGSPRKRRRLIELQMQQGGDAPGPDPNVGAAAKEQADTAAAQLQIAQGELDYQKGRDAQWDPYYTKLADQEFDDQTKASARADTEFQQYQQNFQPIENQVASDATNWDSASRISAARGNAINTTNAAFDQADQTQERNLGRMGISATSGRSIESMNADTNARALGVAGAATTADTDTRLQGIALRQQAAQLGRGIASGSDATSALALNTGSSATGVLGSQEAGHAQGIASVSGLYSGAQAGFGSAASTYGINDGIDQAGYSAGQQKQGALIGAGVAGAATIAAVVI